MNEKALWIHNQKLLFRRKKEVVFIYLFMIIMCFVVAFFEDKFFTSLNIRNIISVSVSLCVATYAQLLIIMLGGVDLSVGSIISATNVICATMMTDSPYGWVIPVILSLLFGLICGSCNGFLVAKAHQQAIIATLATSTIISGIALAILPTPGGYINSGFAKFINRGCGKLMPLIIMTVISIIMWIVLNRTSFGRQLYAVGGNEQAAGSAGIHVDRVKFIAFVFSGVLSAAAGIFISAYITSGDPTVGSQYSQRAITAAVLGGASLSGGKSSIIGCIAGVFVIGIINNMLNLLGVSSYYQYISQGVILIIALAISAFKTR